MRNVVKTTSRSYLFAAFWLLVMLGTAMLATAAMDPLYTTVGLDPMARTVTTMAGAILTATVVTGLGVKSLRPARTGAREATPPRGLVVAQPGVDRAEG